MPTKGGKDLLNLNLLFYYQMIILNKIYIPLKTYTFLETILIKQIRGKNILTKDKISTAVIISSPT